MLGRWLATWWRAALLALLVLGGIAALAWHGRVEQPTHYGDFADQRWGHLLNVASNLPFALVGWRALKLTWPRLRSARRFGAKLDALPAFAFALGVALTALGSAWYHLAPSNARLVWDRIPMTLAFMGLTALAVDRYFVPGARRVLVLPLLSIGVGSVLLWYYGGGDLGPYVLVQGLPLLVVGLTLVTSWRRQRGLGAALLLYLLAKLLESCDRCFYEALCHTFSGHTLKHVAAAAASFAVIPSLTEAEPGTAD